MGVTPKALLSRPSLDERLRYYYSAYNRVSRSRDVSMAGALPLKVSEIAAYCELFKIHSLNERERLFDCITTLDDVYLEHVANKQKANTPT
jgi:hypothetical protein